MTEIEKSEQVKKLAQEIWAEYEPGIRSLCYRKLSGYPQEAEDVVQDVGVALLTALNENRVIRNRRAWLYGVANKLISKKYEELKDRRKKYISFSDFYYCHRLSYEMDMLEPKINDERIDKAKKEIEDQLSDEDNELLDLIYKKGITHRKIARKYKTTESAVKQRSYRLRKNVKVMAHDKIKEIMNKL